MYKLHHVNIVTLFAIILEPPHSDVPGHYGIVMEYVLHGSLNEFVLTYHVCFSVCGLMFSLWFVQTGTFIHR